MKHILNFRFKVSILILITPCFISATRPRGPRWHDGYEGHGEHYFDYNHVGPKEPVHHAPAYAPPKPSYVGPALTNKVYTQINFYLSDQCSNFRERPTIQLTE